MENRKEEVGGDGKKAKGFLRGAKCCLRPFPTEASSRSAASFPFPSNSPSIFSTCISNFHPPLLLLIPKGPFLFPPLHFAFSSIFSPHFLPSQPTGRSAAPKNSGKQPAKKARWNDKERVKEGAKMAKYVCIHSKCNWKWKWPTTTNPPNFIHFPLLLTSFAFLFLFLAIHFPHSSPPSPFLKIPISFPFGFVGL